MKDLYGSLDDGKDYMAQVAEDMLNDLKEIRHCIKACRRDLDMTLDNMEKDFMSSKGKLYEALSWDVVKRLENAIKELDLALNASDAFRSVLERLM